MGGTGLLDKLLEMGASGSGPDAIMGFLEQQRPDVKEHAIWNELKGKSSTEIEQYAKNLVNSLGLNKTT